MRAGNAETCHACDRLIVGPAIHLDARGEHWICDRCADELAEYHADLEAAERDRERHESIAAEIWAIARGRY